MHYRVGRCRYELQSCAVGKAAAVLQVKAEAKCMPRQGCTNKSRHAFMPRRSSCSADGLTLRRAFPRSNLDWCPTSMPVPEENSEDYRVGWLFPTLSLFPHLSGDPSSARPAGNLASRRHPAATGRHLQLWRGPVGAGDEGAGHSRPAEGRCRPRGVPSGATSRQLLISTNHRIYCGARSQHRPRG